MAVREQIKAIEQARLEAIRQAPDKPAHAKVRLLARVIGVGIESADMLVREVLLRNFRARRAVARYAGLTGAPDESGLKRREKGLAKSGNARVRRGLIQLACLAVSRLPEEQHACPMVRSVRRHKKLTPALPRPECLPVKFVASAAMLPTGELEGSGGCGGSAWGRKPS